ncbi:hypothetical protein BSNK01_08660 [Bacillaceae bacterium]
MIDSVLKVAEQKLPRWKVVHVDRERGEIMAEKRHALSVSDIVITVYRISPVRSAIDVVCAKRGSLGDLGSSYRTILEFFHALQTEIQPEEK